MIDNETLQWIAIVGLAVWCTALSLWQGELALMLKSWWLGFLKDLKTDWLNRHE